MVGSGEVDDAAVLPVGDRLAARLAELDPLLATDWGVPSTSLPVLDPEWYDELHELYSSTVRELEPLSSGPTSALLRERASAGVEWIDSGEAYCELQACLDSPLFRLRHCFDDMPTGTADDWQRFAERLNQLPASLAGFRRTLDICRERGAPRASRRQVMASVQALNDWAGASSGPSVFHRLIEPSRQIVEQRLAGWLDDVADRAAAALGETASYLRDRYLPFAMDSDAVGSERFGVWSRRYAGTTIDYDDYDWAANALGEANACQTRLRGEVDRLGPDPTIEGETGYREWVAATTEHARQAVNERDLVATATLPAVQVRVMDPTSAGQTYYSPALEGEAGPATIWVAGGDGPHHIEYAKTVVFHESIPGHHVEASLQRQSADLSRFQRLVYIPAHSEGWALYAERLAEETGLLESAYARLGCRGSQALRYASLLIDMGIHTGLRPARSVQHLAGEDWSAETAVRLVAAQGLDQDAALWWVINMIGRPAHRASYAAGERAWLDARASNPRSSLRDLHTRLLQGGPMGLDQFRTLTKSDPPLGSTSPRANARGDLDH